MVNLEINGKPAKVEEGGLLIDAIREAGYDVPTLCHMKDKTPTGACRMCVVEVEGARGLIPSCSYPVNEGMKVKTHTPKAEQARKTIVELLLSRHPNDCLYCVRSGNCDLQSLAVEYGVREKSFAGKPMGNHIDQSSASITREPDKCVLCGKCVRVCEEDQAVSALDFINRGSETIVGCAFGENLNTSSCINCGQCIMVCPTGALSEKSHTKRVMEALYDPDKYVVIQHAPAISVTIAEAFNAKPGTDVSGQLVATLRQMGFDQVFDTSFSADLTIMEEGSELVHRIKNGGKLPMMTSCSPGWIKFVEQFYPDMIDNLSTCKSPQEMMGAIIKSYFAEKNNIPPEKIFSVSVMPCTAKKFESERPELMDAKHNPDLDAVLTTRELADLIKMKGINFEDMPSSEPDLPFGERSSAGKLFGATGGVMEAAIRSAHFLITGEEMVEPEVEAVRGFDGIKRATVKIGDLSLNVAVVSGTNNARDLLDKIRKGEEEIHFMEVMTCHGGCINGGGQIFDLDKDKVVERMGALYKIDKESKVRCSHNNESIQKLYEDYLEKPLSHKSHELLHTSYNKREVLK
ncbi:MAG: NADH-dependent [FeFe] hydrogenase, group A6 [Fibrobacterales bacterium]